MRYYTDRSAAVARIWNGRIPIRAPHKAEPFISCIRIRAKLMTADTPPNSPPSTAPDAQTAFRMVSSCTDPEPGERPRRFADELVVPVLEATHKRTLLAHCDFCSCRRKILSGWPTEQKSQNEQDTNLGANICSAAHGVHYSECDPAQQAILEMDSGWAD
jgi:hypothetical protein